MARDMGPVLKRCRYLGIDPIVLGVTKKPSRRKRTMRKLSEYGVQLKEKQKVKFIYGVLEKQFRNYYKVADNMHGITGENLLMLLELRLDNVVYRLGLGRTRKEARQIVRHNLIRVNGKKVNIPSYMVKVGDVIEVREKSKQNPLIAASLESTTRDFPGYLEVDSKKMTAKFTFVPKFADIPYACEMEPNLVIEYYSR